MRWARRPGGVRLAALALGLAAAASAAAAPLPPPVTDGHGVLQRFPPEEDGLVEPGSTSTVTLPSDGLVRRHGHWPIGHRRATRAEIEMHLKREMMDRRM